MHKLATFMTWGLFAVIIVYCAVMKLVYCVVLHVVLLCKTIYNKVKCYESN